MTESDAECESAMSSLTDESLLSNEIGFVNGVWDRIQKQRAARKEQAEHLRSELDKLREFQRKGSTSFLDTLRDNLVYIAFLLEPKVDELMVRFREEDIEKYSGEHEVLN